MHEPGNISADFPATEYWGEPMAAPCKLCNYLLASVIIKYYL